MATDSTRSAEELMALALDAARRGIAAGQSPFGCAIMQDETIVAACHNTVWLTTDITAHAEINALRAANRRVGQIKLTGAVVAATCEPCPMCMAALHWAGVRRVYFGATIADAAQAGFNELSIPAAEIVAKASSQIELIEGVRRDDCRELFATWQRSGKGQAY